jgi:signal transduction histidine kinase
MDSVEILIADDHELMRRGLRSIVEGCPTWHVCGEAADGMEAVEKAKRLRPDIVLIDITMPHMDGLQATRAIRQALPGTKVILVSQNDPSIVRQQLAGIGGNGFVGKDELARNLIPAIEKCLETQKHRYLRNDADSNHAAWLEADGEMGSLMRTIDWSKTRLGGPLGWSPALRMMVKFLLANRFPQLLWWGPQFCCLYNDAYIPILGEKHPWALGQPVSEVWQEIWEVLRPLIETPYGGGPATWMEDIPLEINRRGFLEETHFTIAYSPVPDEAAPGGIGGVLATVHEITEQVIGERRLALLRDLGMQSLEPKSVEDACTSAMEVLQRHCKDVPFLLLYLWDPEQQKARFICGSGVELTDRGCPQFIRPRSETQDEVWPISKVIETGQLELIHDLSARFTVLPQGTWSEPPDTAAIVPVRGNLPQQLSALLIVGLSRRVRFDQKYRDFLEMVSTQMGTRITGARAYEEERKRAEALAQIDRAKTVFFSNVSHEFRTPLTLMLGPLEDALSADDSSMDKQRERLEVAHRNTLRLLKLVNTLLDFSRIEAGRMEACYEPTDVSRLTSELASVFRSAIEGAGLRLIINCPELGEAVYVDREMWEKVVFNLLSNAFKFTFSGEIEVSLRIVSGSVELAVRDTGTGIAAEEIPRLFERFYRVKDARGRSIEGSGIGLALVLELAKMHGGTVRVESEINSGSTFIVSVPRGKGHLSPDRIGAARKLESTALRGDEYIQEALRWAPSSQSDVEEASLSSAASTPAGLDAKEPSSRILLADDNADMRAYLQRLLGQKYQVTAVGDGEAALDSARQQPPDLVLADIMMPRLDGFGLLREFRSDQSLKTIPIILVSARAGEESRIEGLRAGADDYLVKPFSARELAARVESNLELAKIRRQIARSEERLRALVNASSYTVYRMNPDWSEMRQLDGRGFISDTVKPRTDWLREYVHPEDHALVLRKIREAVQQKSMFELEHRVHRLDGSVGWTYSRAIPLLSPGGDVIEWFGAASDVTTRKDAEQRYRKLSETLDAEVRARTRELETSNADILRQSEQLRELSQRLLQAQDEERRRIARELHDSAGQTLTVLGMTLAQLAHNVERIAPNALRQIEEAQGIIEHLNREIRTTSYLLHPPLLDECGLASALAWYTEGLSQRSGMEIKLDLSPHFGRIPREMELVVFRVVQESLTNIHRHSGANRALIRIAEANEKISVEIEDNGHGMSAEKLKEIQSGSFGVGIRGMRERLRQFQGTMNIESDASGTRISVTVPLPMSVKAKEKTDEERREAAV